MASNGGTEQLRVVLMNAVELALDVAYHDGTPRDLAVAAEAWSLIGFDDGSILISHASQREALEAVAAARRGRPKRLLRADARGMVTTFTLLVQAGVVTGPLMREAARLRWVARGGHDRERTAA